MKKKLKIALFDQKNNAGGGERFTKKILEERNHRIGYKPYMYIMNDIESVDIDIETDFIIAENIDVNSIIF